MSKSLSLFKVEAESAKNLKVEVNGPLQPEPEKAPREDGINVKFTRDEKEEIRQKANAWNTGMSTLLHDAWEFFKVFYEHREIMLRHKEIIKDVATSLSKNF